MQSELKFALKSLEELKQGLSSAGQAAVIARREAEQARKAAQHVGDGSTERVTEVFQQILGLAAARNQPARRAPGVRAPAAKPEPVKREPRHGFDDAAQPMAILALDGKFKELNPAFTKLVGYKEHEFTKAAWPSPHDRRDYKEQLEQLRQMGVGELREVDVQSTYMHGQGLMVPVVGKLSLVDGRGRLPQHLLLVAEDRHTPGYRTRPSGALARMPRRSLTLRPPGIRPARQGGTPPVYPCSANARTNPVQLRTALAPRPIALPAARGTAAAAARGVRAHRPPAGRRAPRAVRPRGRSRRPRRRSRRARTEFAPRDDAPVEAPRESTPLVEAPPSAPRGAAPTPGRRGRATTRAAADARAKRRLRATTCRRRAPRDEAPRADAA